MPNERVILEKRPLGQTTLQVSRLGIGSHAFHRIDLQEAEKLLFTALDEGINVLDTAECYGHAEELIGAVLGHRRHEYCLITKCGHAAGEDLKELGDWKPLLIIRSIERSLRRLKTDYLDLVLLHSCSEEILQRGEVIEALHQAQKAGKVRYAGYSGDREAALYSINSGLFDVVELSVNIADQEAIDTLIPQAASRKIGVLTKRSLANSVWLHGYQPGEEYLRCYSDRLRRLRYPWLELAPEKATELALRFTLSVPYISTASVGMTNVQRIQQNKAALLTGPLSQEEYLAIRKRWQTKTWWRKKIPGDRFGWHGVN